MADTDWNKERPGVFCVSTMRHSGPPPDISLQPAWLKHPHLTPSPVINCTCKVSTSSKHISILSGPMSAFPPHRWLCKCHGACPNTWDWDKTLQAVCLYLAGPHCCWRLVQSRVRQSCQILPPRRCLLPFHSSDLYTGGYKTAAMNIRQQQWIHDNSNES